MADSPRIEDLRRRVQKDPTSIAFAQLAEELRRAGHHEEAVDVCQAGLAIHPGYLSAHVTLGRALIELNRLEEAATELELVLKSAPENLAAIRGLGDVYQRRGDLGGALAQYRAALALARNDPDLEETVADLAKKVEPKPRDTGADSLSFEDVQHAFLKHAPPAPAEPAVPAPAEPAFPAAAEPTVPMAAEPAVPAAAELAVPAAAEPTVPVAGEPAVPAAGEPAVPAAAEPAVPVAAEPAAPVLPAAEPATLEHGRSQRTVAALEQWLEAIHVVRPERSA